jgi:Fur family zinc uptake transcriptional regulator
MQAKTRKTLDSAEKKCESEGKKLTAPRRAVLAALIEAKQPLKAYDVVAKLRDAKPMTVYRALDFLTAEGYAHRIESLNAYVSCAESHCRHADSQYLVCDSCGDVTELHSHAIDDYIKKNISASGFKLSRKTLELHGTCNGCQD